MTFPTVADIGIYANATSLSDHSANYPATVTANQLLLYMATCDGTGDIPTITGVSGINLLYSGTELGHGSCVYYLDAVGNEDGGTFNVHVTSAEAVCAYCFAIDGWDTGTAPEIVGPTEEDVNNPNPPSITPSWGAEDNLYVVYLTGNNLQTVTTYPTGYGDNNNDDAASTVWNAVCTQEVNGSPEDPGAFLISGVEECSTFTVAVRPVGAAGGAVLMPASFSQSMVRF
jgi:hypothetical protein